MLTSADPIWQWMECRKITNFTLYSKENNLEQFVETEIAKTVLQQLKEHKVVIIRGGPKSGKTQTAFHAAFQLGTTDNYSVFTALYAHELTNKGNNNRKELYIFDDIFGKYSINTMSVDIWKKERSRLKTVIPKWTNLKLVIVCRSQINMPELFDERWGVTQYECSIELSKKDIQLLIKKCFNEEKEELLDNNEFVNFSFYPLLCDRYMKNEKSLRTWSSEIIQRELIELRKDDILTFVTLGFLVVENNSVRTKFCDDHLESSYVKHFKAACDELNVHTPSLHDVRRTLKNLKGTFVIENECEFTTINDMMFTLISDNISQYFINTILNFCPNDMFIEHIGFASLHTLQEDIFLILVPHELEQEYFCRICERIFRYKNFEIFFKTVDSEQKLYRHKFIEYLKTNRIDLSKLRDETNASVLNVIAKLNFDDIAESILSHSADLVEHKDIHDTLPIHVACENRSYNVSKVFLKYDSPINQLNAAGYSPIHIACVKGDNNIVEFLISNKADIDKLSDTSETPLVLACKYKHMQVIDTLLANNADVNKRGLNATPLYHMCESGDIDIIKKLLKYSANVNITSKQDGSAPIHKASYHGHSQTIHLLIKHGGHKNKKDKEGHTALYIACKEGKLDVVRNLLRHRANINGLYNFVTYWHLPQYIAYINDHREVVDFLLKHVNNENDEKYVCLFTACWLGDVKGVDLLLSNEYLNFDINWEMQRGNTALCVACQKEDSKVVELLLKKKPNVNLQTYNGETPLSFACISGNTNIITLLIENNAQVDTVTKRGLSTLFISCLFGHYSTSKILLKNKVSVEVGDKNGWTPLQVCCFNGTLNLLKLIIQNGVNLNQTETVDWLSPSEKAPNVRKQKQSYAKENKREVNNFFQIKIPPLVIACWRNNKQIVDILLKNEKDKADVSQGFIGKNINNLLNKLSNNCYKYVRSCHSNKKDNEDFSDIHKLTAIQLACLNEQVEVVKTLIEYGAKVNMFMPEGKITSMTKMTNKNLIRWLKKEKPNVPNKTALIIACEKGNLDIVSSLLDSHANIHQFTRNGCTPLHVAILNKDHTLINKLLEKSNCKTECHMKDVGTPLILACSKNEKEIVKKLLEHGALVNSTRGKTAIKIAREKNYYDIVSLLLSQKVKLSNKDRQTTAEKHKVKTLYVPIKTRKIHKLLR